MATLLFGCGRKLSCARLRALVGSGFNVGLIFRAKGKRAGPCKCALVSCEGGEILGNKRIVSLGRLLMRPGGRTGIRRYGDVVGLLLGSKAGCAVSDFGGLVLSCNCEFSVGNAVFVGNSSGTLLILSGGLLGRLECGDEICRTGGFGITALGRTRLLDEVCRIGGSSVLVRRRVSGGGAICSSVVGDCLTRDSSLRSALERGKVLFIRSSGLICLVSGGGGMVMDASSLKVGVVGSNCDGSEVALIALSGVREVGIRRSSRLTEKFGLVSTVYSVLDRRVGMRRSGSPGEGGGEKRRRGWWVWWSVVVLFKGRGNNYNGAAGYVRFTGCLMRGKGRILMLSLSFRHSLSSEEGRSVTACSGRPGCRIVRASVSGITGVVDSFAGIRRKGLLVSLPNGVSSSTLKAVLGTTSVVVYPFGCSGFAVSDANFFVRILRCLGMGTGVFFLPGGVEATMECRAGRRMISVLGRINFIASRVPTSITVRHVGALTVDGRYVSGIGGTCSCVVRRKTVGWGVLLVSVYCGIVRLLCVFTRN